MQVDRRALYNSLRLNWLENPELIVEPWQVENYRKLSMQSLFDELAEFGIALDKNTYLAQADDCDTPEDLTDLFTENSEWDAFARDHIHLLIFELWRRLVPEKRSLSIFCDELDHQIFKFDHRSLNSVEEIEDILSYFQHILSESSDTDGDPEEVYASILIGCANDVESFLYEFIAECIDNDNLSYAQELCEGFVDYVEDPKWFDLLNLRISAKLNSEETGYLLSDIVDCASETQDLSFYFELLALITQEGDHRSFKRVVDNTTSLLETESDLTDLLNLVADYYAFIDHEEKEQQVQAIIHRRQSGATQESLSKTDPDLSELKVLVATRQQTV